ncbi:hypothetical protein HYT57_02405 [Candidatus Woesearchaeota archaeon]|nr:hypothetical protein [Candidatus Woesearchaeota archaeon]
MKKVSLKLSKEIKDSLILIILLTLIFAYNDRKEITTTASWTLNLIRTFLIVTVSAQMLILGYKLAAKYYRISLTFGLWRIQELEKKISLKAFHIPLPTYLGQIIAIFVTLVSSGLQYFTAISNFSLDSERIDRKYKYVRDHEASRITIAGIIFSTITLVFFMLLNSETGVIVNTWIIIGNLIPLSTLPGNYIAMHSRTTYVFTAVLAILFLILVGILSIKFALLLALVVALILAIAYFKYIEYGKKMFSEHF